MTSSNQNYCQYLKNVSSPFFAKNIRSKFYLNRSRISEIRACDRHIYCRTDRGRPRSTYSVLKLLNIKIRTENMTLRAISSRNNDTNCFFFNIWKCYGICEEFDIYDLFHKPLFRCFPLITCFEIKAAVRWCKLL